MQNIKIQRIYTQRAHPIKMASHHKVVLLGEVPKLIDFFESLFCGPVLTFRPFKHRNGKLFMGMVVLDTLLSASPAAQHAKRSRTTLPIQASHSCTMNVLLKFLSPISLDLRHIFAEKK